MKKSTLDRRKNPFEFQSEFELNFNFWIEHSHIIQNDFVNFITSVLSDTNITKKTETDSRNNIEIDDHSIENSKHKTSRLVQFLRGDGAHLKTCHNVMLVFVQGFYNDTFSYDVGQSNFLSSCTSVPFRSIDIPFDKINVATNPDYKFTHSDVKPCNSLLYWNKKPRVNVDQLANLSHIDLFGNYDLVFEGKHTEWNKHVHFHSITGYGGDFIPDMMLVDKFRKFASNRLNGSREGSAWKFFYDKIHLLLDVENIQDSKTVTVLGNVGSSKACDGGFFGLTCDENSHIVKLYLMWNRWDVEYLEGHLTDTLNHFEFKKMNPSLVTTRTELALTLLYGYYRDNELSSMKLIQNGQTVSNGRDMKLSGLLSQGVESDVLEREAINTTMSKDSSIISELRWKQLKDTYHDILRQYGWIAFEKMLIPEDLMRMMGFNFMDNNPTASTSDHFVGYLQTANIHPVKTVKIADEVEDGEEQEEPEEMQTETKDVKNESKFDLLVNRLKRKSSNEIDQNTKKLKSDNCEEHSDEMLGMLPLKLCGVDCEMCETEAGLELTRVTLICPVNGVVLDELVKPKRPIINYHSEFSGVTESKLANVTTTLGDIHKKLRQIIDANTILVGHSLDSDLKALKIIHHRVIDTGALYIHPNGIPYKYSLKKLAKDYLNIDIQDQADGHDSAEDAVVAMELMFQKILRETEGIEVSHPMDEEETGFSLNESVFFSFENNVSSINSLEYCVISCPFQPYRPDWENYSFGYRSTEDGNASMSVFKRNNNRALCYGKRCQNYKEAVTGVKEFLHSDQIERNNMKKADSAFPRKTFTGVDISLYSVVDELIDTKDSAVTPMAKVDEILQDLFDYALPSTTMLVIAQSDSRQIKYLAAEKIRSWWDAGSLKKKTNIADCPIVMWDDEMEQKLQNVAFESACSILFLKAKP